MSSKDSETYKLHKALSKNPPIIMKTLVEAERLILNTKDRNLFTFQSELQVVVEFYSSQTYTFPSGVLNHVTFAFRKKDSLRKRFETKLGSVSESGLIKYFIQKYRPEDVLRSDSAKVMPKNTPINIHGFSGSFLILSLGLGLSTMALVAEHLYRRHCYQTLTTISI